jgi:hypothetical protein
MGMEHQKTDGQGKGVMLGLIFVLNLLDTGFTMFWVNTGLGSEANPLLRRLAHDEWGTFLLVKIVLVGLGLWFIWRFSANRITAAGLPILLTAYLGVVLYHSGVMVGLAFLPTF